MKLSKQQNLFFAKKLFAEFIYNSALLEGCNVTFPQTQTIIDGAVINNVSVDDIQTVLNLRDGYRYLLHNIDLPLDLTYICKINEFVSRNESLSWGTLRTGQIGVSGTKWIPPVPNAEDVTKHLEKIMLIEDPTDRATEYFCYTVKSQLFWDGNKRTSTIVANKILIENGIGVLTIDEYNAQSFNETLLHYYNTDEKEPLKECLKKCIKTMSINQ